MTLVPLSVFFNNRGIAKVSLGLAKGKTHIDRRDDIKKREWQREQARLMRSRG
jgi:SsrA-binding protein